MNSVERVKAICKERKIPISKIERALRIHYGGQLWGSVHLGGMVPDLCNTCDSCIDKI